MKNFKAGQRVSLELSGQEYTGEIIQEWDAMPDKIAVELKEFDYNKTNFFFHIIEKVTIK